MPSLNQFTVPASNPLTDTTMKTRNFKSYFILYKHLFINVCCLNYVQYSHSNPVLLHVGQ